MKKKDRQLVFEKYGGKCAYCGCDLQKGWHVDEIEPVIRCEKYLKDEHGSFIMKENGSYATEKFLQHPERVHIDNQNPACASCNIQKNSFTIEQFRENIKQFVNSLNRYSTQYKFAKRYGLVQETDVEVKFYYETIEK